MRQWVFYFHYNKPLSRKRGRPVISVVFRGKHYYVSNVVVGVPTYGHLNRTQPHFVIKGRAGKLVVTNGIAYLT